MEYLFYYLIAGTILVFFTNLIVYILKKDTEFIEFPFVIIWFGFIMNLFSFTIKNTAIALGVLIVFPFLNMFVAYENLTKRKHI